MNPMCDWEQLDINFDGASYDPERDRERWGLSSSVSSTS